MVSTAVSAGERVGDARRRIGFGPRFVAPVVIGSMLNPINSTMISTALVPIGKSFSAGAAATIWLVSGLYVASAIAQPAMGKVADRIGARRVYISGLIIVGLAGIGGLLAPSLGWLIAVRVFIGIGTSAAYPAAMAMVRKQSQTLGQEVPGIVLGWLTIAGLVSAAIGPALGGLLISAAGWRAIFAVNIPLAVIGLILTLLWLPKDEPEHHKDSAWVSLDPFGVVLFTGLLLPLLVFLMDLKHPAWWSLGLSVVIAAVMAGWELRAPKPFIDLRMLAANGPLVRTYARYGAAYLVIYCILYGYPQWMQEAGHYSAGTVGLITLPMSVVAALCSWFGSRKKKILGPLVIGTIAMIVATVGLSTVSATAAVWFLAAIGIVFGIPNGLNAVGNQAALYQQAPPEQTGTAAGLFRTAQYIGAIASSSLISLFYGERATTGGLHTIGMVLGALSVLLLLATVVDPSVVRRRKRTG
ncbi:MFS transporter [Streptantibioticus cattleyicolor]|uniref:Major facilitator superfamily MFS_1 n=1 Tax=Streptantibioticus cattleyicolor (strain ATCC 35852 / DSM 46488 / JCM 4925 / NBRC 14057 / NRRL 8057) TaxID=1003195 RepID=F8JMY5_STREN|nr:MFS transporter [Streptantibioticus cattleyicolor]AEW98577.1 major facilitator superfamily MFS_1 [Streptantibioticus cattleyicolor NRRL 8057 = DSM 46488]CCB72364.1 Major facilitator superfamily MFS1 [Streptantibioticus cattleyicolor NRRL 8057 = DSM 46488]